ncbi:MAG TPA: M3 family metallopeptidase, partial [Devosia sp.]|nr:M3 family metallopeptidase [Devosia sp.]
MSNPFFETWSTPFGAPPFDLIRTEHFRPAYDRALEDHAREIAAIGAESQAPTFENTIVALERSGQLLRRVEMIFSQLCHADTNEEMQAVERVMSPIVTRHWTGIYLNPQLFARVDALHRNSAQLGLDPESLRLLERYHLDFVRSGARLTPVQRERFAAIMERLATLGTTFGQNVLADEQSTVFALTEAEVEGLPAFARAAAAETARDRKLNAPFAATTSRSSVEPILHFAHDRGVREKVWRAFVNRGRNGNAHDNRAVIAEMVDLRAELAALLGYDSYAAYKLDDSMARTPEAAQQLLEDVWAPGRRRAAEDREALQALAGGDKLEAWDWRYYSEKLRLERYSFDENELKPYLALDKVVGAAFFTAERLFGISFEERDDIPVYHPDVRVWAVLRAGTVI